MGEIQEYISYLQNCQSVKTAKKPYCSAISTYGRFVASSKTDSFRKSLVGGN